MKSLIALIASIVFLGLGLMCAGVSGMFAEEGKAREANNFLGIAAVFTGLGAAMVKLT